MSVTGIGASPYPTAQPWSGPPGNWQANRPNDQNSNNTASTTANNAATNNVTNNGAGTNASANSTSNSANNTTNDRNANDNNPLPAVQAATSPGTGQKVNVIA